jgi:hypothetical protein
MKLALGPLVIVLLCASDAISEVFETRDDFSMTLPNGWVEAPPEALRGLETRINQVSDGAIEQHYDYGYQRSSANTWFEYPYILVQVKKGGRIREGQLTQYEKVQAQLREGMEKGEESLSAIVSDITQGDTLYDEINHILWSAFTMNVQGVGEVRGLVGIKLTKFGFIQVAGYATESTFGQYSPIFSEAVRTLNIAEKYKYQPRLTDHAPTVWGINLGETAIAGLFGGIAGGVIGLITYLKKKKKRPGT